MNLKESREGCVGSLRDEKERRNIVIKFPSQNKNGLVQQFCQGLTMWTRFPFANRIEVNYRFVAVTKHDLLQGSHALLGGECTINVTL